MFGPEAEFFVFDDVRFDVPMRRRFYEVDLERRPVEHRRRVRRGNMGHRPGVKGGYFPVRPSIRASDLRAEMLSVMTDMGLIMEKHHHEVAPAQHELGFKFDTLVKCADNVQIYKYAVHNVAHTYGKTATFMPKPLYRRQRLGHAHPPVDLEGRQAAVRRRSAMPTCRRWRCTTSAASSSTPRRSTPSPTRRTNSYKRLIPGFEAPVLLAYSSRNRSASCRIPYSASPEGQARRSPLPRSVGQSVPRLRGDADGRASTASRTRSIPATRWTRTSTTCRRRS